MRNHLRHWQIPGSFTVLNLMGTMQTLGAVPGAAIGAPNMSAFAPRQWLTRDCLHPSRAAERELATSALAARYFFPDADPRGTRIDR